MERKNLWGKEYVEFKQNAKSEGYRYMVTYNPSSNWIEFVDRCFKTRKGAERFYNSLASRGIENRKIKEIQ